MTFVASTIGSAAGPPFAGLIFDKYGSYVVAFVVFIITYAVGAFMSFLAVPPKPLHASD
jgi:cyanate permease